MLLFSHEASGRDWYMLGDRFLNGADARLALKAAISQIRRQCRKDITAATLMVEPGSVSRCQEEFSSPCTACPENHHRPKWSH